jgi:trehalose 6-phosphate phosphatase
MQSPAGMDSVLEWIDRAIDSDREILVATDFDGTLVEIEDRPELVTLTSRASSALRSLVKGGRTHVAVLTGRTRAQIHPFVAELAPIWVATDHGSHIVDPGGAVLTTPAPVDRSAHSALFERAEAVARCFRGARVETKPTSVALHFREVEEPKQEAIEEMFRLSCAAHGARILCGRKVIEGQFGLADKGSALRTILERLPRDTAVIYAGDDVTDEPALAYVHAQPLGLALHIFSGERLSPRVHVHGWLDGPREWIDILEALATLRG